MSERKQAKSYTAEFKESAVKLAVESKRPLTQTVREFGVSKDTLYGWVRQYHGLRLVSGRLGETTVLEGGRGGFPRELGRGVWGGGDGGGVGPSARRALGHPVLGHRRDRLGTGSSLPDAALSDRRPLQAPVVGR